jgi:hypothetical protein
MKSRTNTGVNLTVFLLVLGCSFAQDIVLESVAVKCFQPEHSENDPIILNWNPAGPLDSIDENPNYHQLTTLPNPNSENTPGIPLKLVRHCPSKKLLLTLRIPHGSSASNNMIIVDKVQNHLTGRTSRLVHPISVKIHATAPLQAYSIHYLYKVNGKSIEEVIPGDTKVVCGNNGVDMNSPKVCGMAKDQEGNSVTKTGFCCSCKGGKRCKSAQKLSNNALAPSTAHCFRFSPFWYGVFKIKEPQLDHKIQIQIFSSQEKKDKASEWIEYTKGQKTISAQSPEFTEVAGGLNIKYRNTAEPLEYLNTSLFRILLPIPPINLKTESSIPPAFKGPVQDSVLVVPKTLIAPKGAHCDRVGVTHTAFVNQKDPCQQEVNACLQNQPFDLWMQNDSKFQTKFKLSSIGSVAVPRPIEMHSRTQGTVFMQSKWTTEDESSYVDIEIPANELLLLSPGYNVRIQYILTEKNVSSGARIIAELINEELVAGSFRISLKNCSGGIASVRAEGKMKRLEPLKSQEFVIDLTGQDSWIQQGSFCIIVVLNEFEEAVAARRITFSPGDTCICLNACACTCTKDSLQCAPLSRNDRLAAGMGTGETKQSSRNDEEELRSEAGEIIDPSPTAVWTFLEIAGLLCIPLTVIVLAVSFCACIIRREEKSVGDLSPETEIPDKGFFRRLCCCCFRNKPGTPSPIVSAMQVFPEGDKKHFSLTEDDVGQQRSPTVMSSSIIASRQFPTESFSAVKPSSGVSLKSHQSPLVEQTYPEVNPAVSKNSFKPSSNSMSTVNSSPQLQSTVEPPRLPSQKSLGGVTQSYTGEIREPVKSPLQSQSYGGEMRSSLPSPVLSQFKPRSDDNLQATKSPTPSQPRMHSSRDILKGTSHSRLESAATSGSAVPSVFRNDSTSRNELQRLEGEGEESEYSSNASSNTNLKTNQSQHEGGQQSWSSGGYGRSDGSRRRFGSWHTSAETVRSITELCQLTSKNNFDFNQRPDPHSTDF